MSSYRRSRRCPRCKRLRAAASFDGRKHRMRLCRVCRLRAAAHGRGDAPVVELLDAYADLEHVLHAALGQQWPQKLLRAREGAHAR